MSIRGILKNIYSYLEVLQGANTDAVRGWDEESLENALQWAAYCEEVYKRALENRYGKALDEHIRSLGRMPWNVGGLAIDLILLKDATQHIQKALENNPDYESPEKDDLKALDQPLPRSMCSEILQAVLGAELVGRVVRRASHAVRLALLRGKANGKKLHHTSATTGDTTPARFAVSANTRHDLDLIMSYLTTCSSDSFLVDAVCSVATMSGGALVLLLMCAPGRDLFDESARRSVFPHIMEWLTKSPGHVQTSMWSQPSEILCMAFESNGVLLQQYTQYCLTAMRSSEETHVAKRIGDIDDGFRSVHPSSGNECDSISKQLEYLINHGNRDVQDAARRIANTSSTRDGHVGWDTKSD